MITALDCFKKFGHPDPNAKWLTLWDVPAEIEIGMIPNKLFCNKALIIPLTCVFTELIKTGLFAEIKTWDGCFNIRTMRGYEDQHKKLMDAGEFEKAMTLMSIHSWAIAVDVNAFENQLYQKPKLSERFVNCWKANGFDWGVLEGTLAV
jgi:hypothetical protein